jgi:hypothetical protein
LNDLNPTEESYLTLPYYTIGIFGARYFCFTLLGMFPCDPLSFIISDIINDVTPNVFQNGTFPYHRSHDPGLCGSVALEIPIGSVF